MHNCLYSDVLKVHHKQMTRSVRDNSLGDSSTARHVMLCHCPAVSAWIFGCHRTVWVGFSLSEYNYTATNYNQPLPQALGSTCVKKSFATPFDARRTSLMLPTILDIWPDNCPCGDPARYLFGTLGYTIWQSQNVLDNGKP